MLRIKRATLDDAPLIMDINVKAFNDEMNRVLGRDGGPPGYDTLEEHQRVIEGFLCYKMLWKGQAVGSFFLVPHSEEHLGLESYCIYPEFQNRGLGYKGLVEMEKMHPKVKKWTLESMKGSDRIQHLYEKFGYVQTAEEEWFYSYEKILD